MKNRHSDKWNIIRRVTAFCLAMLMCVSAVPMEQVSAAKSENKVIEVATAEELLAVAKKCHLDSWSVNKTIRLTKDISLKGKEFEPIAVFSGTFDGGGHTISDFNYTGAGYAEGLFRYIEKTGIVKDLTVKGSVSSTEEEKITGGICGVNRGIISNCTFNGNVTGQVDTGGIAGVNKGSGVIENCRILGKISGYYSTGGIAGKNHGTIRECQNQAAINNDEDWVSEEDENGLMDIIGNLTENAEEESVLGSTDTGGICGYSDGVIAECLNKGVIGYIYAGYNIGGIAGRQSGTIISCNNTGRVYGRKDVGGIVGQMEPYVSVEEAESIREAVQDLHDIIDKTIDDMDVTEDVLSSDAKVLADYADGALDSSHSMVNQLADFTDSNIENINQLADRISYVLEKLPDILADAESSVKNMRTVSEDLNKLSDDLDIITKMENNIYDETALKRLSLISGVGGSIAADNNDPAEGVKVTITVSEEKGYRLAKSGLRAQDANGKEVALEASGDNQYTMTMPKDNVVIYATYTYVGEYVPVSNAGGEVTVDEDGDLIKIQVNADNGYQLKKIQIGSEDITSSLNAEGYGEFKKSKYPTGDSIVLVRANFEKKAQAHQVSTASSTGGVVTLDSATAAEGDTVTITTHRYNGYRVSAMKIVYGTTEKSILENTAKTDEYTFTMPDADVRVETVFAYDTANGEADVYGESTAGGTVSAVGGQLSNNYTITLTPQNGYEVSDGTYCLQLTDSAASPKTVEVKKADMEESGDSFTYTMDKTQYTLPVKAYAVFQKKEGTRAITCVDGTGGTVTADASTAMPKDEITIAAVPATGYRLAELRVEAGGKEITTTKAKEAESYTFTMPDADVTITASYVPIQVIVTSNAGGQVSYTVNDGIMNFRITPEAGYTVSETPVFTDKNGNTVAAQKIKQNSFEYELAITESIEPISVNILFRKQSDYQTVNEAKNRISSKADELSGAMESAGVLTEEIRKLVTDDSGNVINWEDFTTEQQTELLNLLVELAKELAIAGDAAATIIKDISIISSVLDPYLEEANKALSEDMDQISEDMNLVFNDIESALNGVQVMVSYLNGQKDIVFTKLGDEFTQTSDQLYQQLKGISDVMDVLTGHMDYYTDILNDDFRAINDQLNEVLMLFIDKMEEIENAEGLEWIYEDVSEEDIAAATQGKVERCINNGAVEGDLNIGGVAGALTFDEEDPEENAAGDEKKSLGSKYLTKCILATCVNNGSAKSRADGVGGLAGYMNLGIITDSENYGVVRSTQGDYAGGICGDSTAVIRNCYAMGNIYGNKYVGGIAGYGKVITNSYALATADATTGRVGAIAGQIADVENEDRISTESQNVYGNYYVSDEIYGIDGISYAGVAEPLDYAGLLSHSEVPAAFGKLKLICMIEGEIVDTISVNYGDDLSKITLPQIPDKKGYHAVWPNLNGKTAYSSMVLEAEYRTYVKTLESEEKVTVKDKEKKALALASGNFTEEVVLHATESSLSLPAEVNSKEAKVYDIGIGNVALDETDETKMRIWNHADSGVDVWQYKNGAWEKVDADKKGSYVQVTMQGTRGSYCVVPRINQSLWLIIIAGVIAVGIVSVICVRKKRKKKVA